MRTVLLFGTFDFLHIGHLVALRAAKRYGQRLVVIVTRDAVAKQMRGEAPIHTERERQKIVAAVRMVDTAALGDTRLGAFSVIQKFRPDVIAVGYDQKELRQALREYLQKSHLRLQIIALPAYRPRGRKSSAIKKRLTV